MENHPIPQQISSYQFHLVGDMTLKQFLQLAGGALISLLIYATGLPFIIKWPLIIFFGLAGAALAFLPFQERPLEKWVLAFFRSVYSPTLYFWKKLVVAPVYFQPETAPIGPSLPTGAVTDASTTNLEKTENQFLSKLGEMFQIAPTAAIPPSPPVASPPLPATMATQFGAPTQAVTKQREFEVSLPKPVPISITPTWGPKFVVEEKPTAGGQATTTAVSQTLAGGENPAAQMAQFSVEAAPPHPPSEPNVIVGQVMDTQGKIVEGTILEIQDEQGRPVRALKSNKAGHFMIVTPLLNGRYTMIIEKEGFTFEPLQIDVVGSIIPPIAVRAKEGNING